MHSNAPAVSERRADIDYLRVGALLLLIVYHVLLVFNSEWWRVKSDNAGHWADYFVSVLTPWRMALVFMIGGMAARFMIEKMRTRDFMFERAGKLLTAFAFAVIILIPLQRYVRLDNDGATAQSYLDFLRLGGRFAVDDHGVWLPDFANAWFLPYLFAYSVLAALLWRLAPRLFAGAQHVVDAAPIWLLAGVGMVWFGFVESAIIPTNPVSGLLVPDIGAHMRFLPVFVFGMLVGKSASFTTKVVATKIWFWMGSLALLAITLAMQWRMLEAGVANPMMQTEWLVLRGFYGATMLFGALGLAAWAFTKPSPRLTWASDAILPIYLMHQTVLVVVADAITQRGHPLGLEFALLLTATFLIPLTIYALLVRHVSWLRVLFGLRPKARSIPREGGAPESGANPHPAGQNH